MFVEPDQVTVVERDLEAVLETDLEETLGIDLEEALGIDLEVALGTVPEAVLAVLGILGELVDTEAFGLEDNPVAVDLAELAPEGSIAAVGTAAGGPGIVVVVAGILVAGDDLVVGTPAVDTFAAVRGELG